MGGVQAGYNWQVRPNWLAGIEADIDASDIRGHGSSQITVGGFTGNPTVSSERVSWFGTVRGRVGWLPTNNFLVYGTGGFAYGQVKARVVTPDFDGLEGLSIGSFGFRCFAGSNCFVGSSSSIQTGWSAGAGFETLVSNNITFKLEYLYVNLGGQNVNVVAVNSFGATNASSFKAHFDTAFNVVRIGFNWKY